MAALLNLATTLRPAGFALVSLVAVGLGLMLGQYLAAPASAANTFSNKHNKGMYDTTTPGITTNEVETWCVRNFTDDPTFSPSTAASLISAAWNSSQGWELIGGTKVNFPTNPSNCALTNPCTGAKICVDFHDATDSPFSNPNDPQYCPGAACGGITWGSWSDATVTDGHDHWSVTGIKINLNYWKCYGSDCTDYGRKRLINHEVGHNLGLDHDGPQWGVTSGGNLYESYYGNLPTTGEVNQSRAHLNGRPSPGMHPCIAFPGTSAVWAYYFDTAIDDESNKLSFWKRPLAGGSWTNVMDTPELGSYSGIYRRIGGSTGSQSGVTSNMWTARVDIRGGPRHDVNWDPVVWAPGDYPRVNSSPNKPCVAIGISSSTGYLMTLWQDASFNETGFKVWYSISPGDGALGSWIYRGAYTAGYLLDNTANGYFNRGDRVCVRVAAYNSYGQSDYSNITCAWIL